jgi:DNA-binding NarL/FixJ family response regulator
VLIVDDHRSARHALAALLSLHQDVEVVGEAASESEALELANRHTLHVVLMGVERPPMGGVDAIRLIKRACPHVRVMVLSIHDDVRERAMNEGADAFLVKGGPPEGLLAALRQLHDRT